MGKSRLMLEVNFQLMRENPSLKMEICCQEKPNIPEDLKERIFWKQSIVPGDPNYIFGVKGDLFLSKPC